MSDWVTKSKVDLNSVDRSAPEQYRADPVPECTRLELDQICMSATGCRRLSHQRYQPAPPDGTRYRPVSTTGGLSGNEAEDLNVHRGSLTLNTDRLEAHWKAHPTDLTLTEFGFSTHRRSAPGLRQNRNQLMEAATVLDDSSRTSHIKRSVQILADRPYV